MRKFIVKILWMAAAAPGLLSGARLEAYDRISVLPAVEGRKEMQRPSAVAAAFGRVYVFDEDRQALLIYTDEGQLVRMTGKGGKESGAFSSVKGLSPGPDNTLYAADTGNSRVQIFDAEGQFLSAFGSAGKKPGQMRSPQGVAACPDGRVYVADTGNSRVQVFSPEGIFLFVFPSAGGDEAPESPGKITCDLSGMIHVLDSGRGRVVKYGPDGKYLGAAQLGADSFAVDDYGFLYTLKNKAGKVEEYGPKRNSLGEFGSAGKGAGQYNRPEDIAVAGGVIYVADTGNKRIQRIAVENAAKTDKLRPASTRATILVGRPDRRWQYTVSLLSPASENRLAGYLPQSSEVAIFGEGGVLAQRFGGKGEAAGRIGKASAVAYHAEHGFYVADAANNRVQRFNSFGSPAGVIGEKKGWGGRRADGILSSPGGVAVNDKTLYVADTGNSRVQVFNPEGAFLSEFSQIGSYALKEPTSLAWDEAGFLWVLDAKLQRLFKCEPSGSLADSWSPGEKGWPADWTLYAAAADGKGYVYLLDRERGRVHLVDRKGRWAGSFFSAGSGETELAEPSAVAFWDGRLAAADPGQKVVKAYPLRVSVPAPSGVRFTAEEGSVHLEWEAPESGWAAKVRVYRAASSAGPFELAAETDASSFDQADLKTRTTYFFRLSTLSTTGQEGPKSQAVPVYVPGSANRASIEISEVSIQDIFSSNYKSYAKNPLGRLWIANNTPDAYPNVKLSFALKGFMDFPTDVVLKSIPAGEKAEVPLTATLSNRVLEVTEDTPVQTEFKLTYYEQGQEKIQTLTKTVKVYSRNTIIWDHPERLVNFITPKEPSLLDFTRKIIFEGSKGLKGASLINANVLTAVRVWNALGVLGMQFLANPTSPYEKVSEDPTLPIDYAQFPTETLNRRSGQCDDIVALISTLLEGLTVPTVLLDYPGHLALMFGLGGGDPLEIGLPEDQMVRYEGQYWIPLEATLISSSFDEAHRQALYSYRKMEQLKQVAYVEVRKAWRDYEPATLPATDWTAPLPDFEKTRTRDHAVLKELVERRYGFLKSYYRRQIEKSPKNTRAMIQLGLVEAEADKNEAALEQFEKALKSEPGNPDALNNLGNLAFMSGDYAMAEDYYSKASGADPEDAGILLNRARAALKRKEPAAAREHLKKALELDPTQEIVVGALMKEAQP